MPRQVGWSGACGGGHAISCSYDPRNHVWATNCPRCESPISWEPKYAKPPKRGSARDQQRSRVYKAEREVKDKECLRDDWREHVREILFSAGVYNEQSVYIADGRGCRNASASKNRITLPRWARTVMVACHEVAHTVNWIKPAHGPEWAAIFYILVKKHASKRESDELHDAFRKHHVKVDWDRVLSRI